MQKEVVLAIIVGSLLGVIVAFGIYKANASLNTQSKEKQAVQQQNTNQGQNIDDLQTSLVIAKPKNYSVLQQDNVDIEGLTKTDSYLVLVSNEALEVVKTSGDGSFSIPTDLTGGINNLSLFSIKDGTPQQKNMLTLVYTSKFDGSENPEASPSGNLDDKVNEKLELAVNSPTSYIGTVTDITEGSFQIRAENDEIRQVAINEATTYANIVKTSKEIKFSELAIGDYIAALGFKSENEILSAKRVLVTTQEKESEYEIHLGKVVNINSAKIEIRMGQENTTYEIDKNTRIRQFDPEDNSLSKMAISKFDEEDLVILVAKTQDEETTLEAVIRLSVDN